MTRTLANWVKGANRLWLVLALLVTCTLASQAMLFTGTSTATVACYSVDPATGWTKVCPSVDSNIIYVSDSLGLDTYDGSSPVHTTGNVGPVKTLAYATQTTTIGTLGVGLRVGKPDWLLLKKGDTWLDQILGNYSYTGVLLASGRSATEPLLISSYSTTGVTALTPRGTGTGARPLIKGGLTNAQRAMGFGFTLGTTQDAWEVLDYLAVIGIELYDYRRDPANAGTGYDATVQGSAFFWFNNPTNWMLFEDNKWSFGETGLITGGIGTAQIVGSFSGTTLTVSSITTPGFSGLASSFSGNAIRIQGTSVDTYIVPGGAGSGIGGTGTYTISPSVGTVGSQTLTVSDAEGRHSILQQNVIVRRNITAYNYTINAGSLTVGMLLSQIANLTDEENFAINDGWYSGVGDPRTTFNHGHYIHENDNSFAPGQVSNETAVGNTAINNAFAGIWCRSCRLADNNLAYGNTLGIGYAYNLATPANPTNAITNNVVMQSVATSTIPGNPTWGIELNSTPTGTVAVPVHNNLVANAVQPDPTGTNNYNAMFIGVSGVSTPPQQQAATVTGNTFCNWPLSGGATASVVDYTPLKLNTITPNVDQPSNCTGLGPFPTRDLATYDASLGGPGTVANYIARILGTPGTLSGQSRDNWNSSVTAPAANNYFRAGYGLTAYP